MRRKNFYLNVQSAIKYTNGIFKMTSLYVFLTFIKCEPIFRCNFRFAHKFETLS